MTRRWVTVHHEASGTVRHMAAHVANITCILFLRLRVWSHMPQNPSHEPQKSALARRPRNQPQIPQQKQVSTLTDPKMCKTLGNHAVHFVQIHQHLVRSVAVVGCAASRDKCCRLVAMGMVRATSTTLVLLPIDKTEAVDI